MVAQTKRDKAEERRAKAAALRKAAAARTRRRRILVIVGAVVAVVAIVVVAVVVWPRGSATTAAKSSGSQIIPATPTGAVTVQQKPTRVANKSGISGVLAWDTTGWPGDGAAHAGALEHDHVAGPVKYAVLPPVGGPHNPIWMNAGVYTKPIPSERAVHNLEHGAVWITYNSNLPAAEVTKLTAFVSKQSMISESGSAAADQANRYIDLSPWASNALPSPIVISAWGYQLRVTSPTDPRLQQFVDKFRHNATYSPEFGAAVDGVPIQTGGRPDLDGSKQPSPAGAAQ